MEPAQSAIEGDTWFDFACSQSAFQSPAKGEIGGNSQADRVAHIEEVGGLRPQPQGIVPVAGNICTGHRFCAIWGPPGGDERGGEHIDEGQRAAPEPESVVLGHQEANANTRISQGACSFGRQARQAALLVVNRQHPMHLKSAGKPPARAKGDDRLFKAIFAVSIGAIGAVGTHLMGESKGRSRDPTMATANHPELGSTRGSTAGLTPSWYCMGQQEQ